MSVLESQRLTEEISKLFKPAPPLKYVEPCDYSLEERKCQSISGSAQFLRLLKHHDPDYTPTETAAEARQRAKKEREHAHAQFLKDMIRTWDPMHNEKAIGDAANTLFVGRLSYAVTDDMLQQEFSRYGPVVRARVVQDLEGKSRGYGFVVFENEKDLRVAFREARGAKILSRRIIIDIERGRTVAEWKPRKLGGGRGGRHYTKEEMFRAREAMRFSGRGGAKRYNEDRRSEDRRSFDRPYNRPADRPYNRSYERRSDDRRTDSRPRDRGYDRRPEPALHARPYDRRPPYNAPARATRPYDDRPDERQKEKDRLRMQYDEKRREASRADPREKSPARWRY